MSFEPFIIEFLTQDEGEGHGQFPGVAVAPGGAILIADDQNGVIHRIHDEGE